MVFARRGTRIQQAIVEIGDASSGFLQFVAMGSAAIDAARCPPSSRPVARLGGPERRSVHGRLHVPSACDLLSQHQPTSDEWSSPGELIHPGDLASISSSQAARRNVARSGYSGWPRLGSYLSRRPRGANCQRHIPALWLSIADSGKCRGTPCFTTMIVSQCFLDRQASGATRCRSRLSCGRWWPVTFRGREPPLVCCRRCLAGYGQSRRARGLRLGLACAA